VGDGFYRGIVVAAQGMLAGLRVQVVVHGADRIPADGGAVIASNHIGYFDFIFIGAAAKERGRLVRFMCKKEVFDHPVGGPVMRGMRHIPVDRGSGSGSFAQALRDLRSGEIVGLFPEATISRSFEPMAFKPGATALAGAAGVPLLPAAIWGSQRVWTKAGRHLTPTRAVPVHVLIGEPMTVERRADHEAVGAELQTRVTALVHDLQDQYPDSPAPGDDWWLPNRLGGTAPTPADAALLDERRAAEKASRAAPGDSHLRSED
jgi:1-acyl-sn-glycerol-3-phosphate acyltransferase